MNQNVTSLRHEDGCKFPCFLISALGEGKWSVSRPGRYKPAEMAHGISLGTKSSCEMFISSAATRCFPTCLSRIVHVQY